MIIERHRIFLLSVCFIWASCSTTNHLPKGEKLYKGAKVTLKSTGLTVKERKVLKTDLDGLTRPKPNSRFLGIPFKLAIYNTFYNKKPKSFFGKLRSRYGEPPVLLSSIDLPHNIQVLQSHLENKGFFKAKVTGDTAVKNKTAIAKYTAVTGPQYKINQSVFQPDSSVLTKAIQATAKNTLLKKGNPYDLDLIKGERTRIDANLKEKGYYFFSPDYLLMKVDSTAGNNTVNMMTTVKPETPTEAREPYRIKNVYIYSGYNLTTANLDTNKTHAEVFEGYNIIDRRKRFKPRMFAQLMQFKPSDIYNRTDHNLTLSRLINLNEFKYVKNRFEPTPGEDSAYLDAYYYLTPLPKKSLRAEVNATTKSNNLNGTELTLSWRNRNALRGGEQLSVSAYVGSEIYFGGSKKGYNTYRSGGEINFALPRFYIPFADLRTRGGYVPRTNFKLGYDLLNRQKSYTLNSYRFGLGYLWKENIKKSHEFYPVSINYIQPLNVTSEYRDSIKRYPYLSNIIDSQFIIGSTYQFNYNELAAGVQKTNSFYFNGLVDLSGNIAGLFAGTGTPSNPKRLFSAVFDQYIKLEVDGRYYRKFGLNTTWANRIIMGYGNPYGNSKQLPFIKQFFVGGNNSIRAFRSRSLGPGTYHEVNNKNFFADQTGDLKLEMNTEFRPHISGPIYGAVFLDAGNIWLKNEDPDRPGAKFSKDFLNQLAVGTGAGIRFDITLFVIRFDVGIPLRKPWEQNPWVINQIRLNKATWRNENIVYNLAIGYPF